MGFEVKDYLKDYSNSDDEIKLNLSKELARYFQCGFCYPVSNGTVAIEVALKALELPRGSEVLIPDLSFIATATAVANCGLIPVYADISPDYFGLTLEGLKAKYHPGIRAVIVVHLAGVANREIMAIKDFCQEHHLYLIEDCAQAFSASVQGKKVGTIGDIGTYSLQSSKLVNCGEGGFILTDNEALFMKCELISNWGYSPRYGKSDLSLPSSNFRLSAVQSYLVLKQLEMIDDIVAERLAKVSALKEAATSMGITVKMPEPAAGFIDCPFFFVIGSQTKIYTIEPRAEYPMRNSTIVKAILKRFYPDLLEKYQALNPNDGTKWNSDCLLEEVNFINIRQYRHLSPTELFEPYRG